MIVTSEALRDKPAVVYKTKIERVRGLDGAPRHLFLWDVRTIGGSKRVIGCGTVRTKSDAQQKVRETIERAERPRLIRSRLLEALRRLPQDEAVAEAVADMGVLEV